MPVTTYTTLSESNVKQITKVVTFEQGPNFLLKNQKRSHTPKSIIPRDKATAQSIAPSQKNLKTEKNQAKSEFEIF